MFTCSSLFMLEVCCCHKNAYIMWSSLFT